MEPARNLLALDGGALEEGAAKLNSPSPGPSPQGRGTAVEPARNLLPLEGRGLQEGVKCRRTSLRT